MAGTVPIRSRDEAIFGGGKHNKEKDPPSTPQIDRAVEQLGPSSTAADYKQVGNLCFQNKMFSAAIKHYTSALQQDPTNATLLSNRSAAYLQSVLLSGPSMALKDAEAAIAADPAWFKGYLRKGDALFAKDQLEKAIEAYQKCLELNGECATAAESLLKCQEAINTKSSPERARPPPPEEAPYDASKHRPQQSAPEHLKDEEKLDTETLIKTWSKDTEAVPDATARKKFKASLDQADRQAGKAYKEQLMSSFRKKLETDPEVRRKVEESLEKEKLAGDGYNYRKGSDKKMYSKGTDEVGLAISAEAYKSYKKESQLW